MSPKQGQRDHTLAHHSTPVATRPLPEAVVPVPDLLGEGYHARTIQLPDDHEGEVVATLVHRRAAHPTGDAVLYLHGFSDYFFQTELADFHTDRGVDFYALDLRKYGRSLRPHQTPGYTTDIREYFVELTAAAEIIRAEYGHRRLIINAHSTGGLISALWAHRVRDRGLVDGIVLNSPWLDMQGSWLIRNPTTEAVNLLGRLRPRTVIRQSGDAVYGYSIYRGHHGEWDYDLTLKPLEGFPIRAGWIRAIRHAHRWLHHGLDIRCPVLVLCSAASRFPRAWHADALRFDTVLDSDQIARWSSSLGRHVTLVRIEDGLHDLILSPRPVRDRAYAEIARWLAAYLPAG